ncbi:MAG TPA: DUF1501 domain-containing protein [Methylomirabilota bacterium]|nr:DUF1501 domain-containing protein [Methylomirabilota bacterium]
MHECTRRSFMKGGALALFRLGTIPRFLLRTAYAEGRGARPKILIAVFQRGAVDGLSMIVPHGDPAYYSARGSIAIARPAQSASETTIDLDGFFGLHPALEPLKAIWDDRRLAVVHACGSPDITRSHFDAQDYMESGTPGLKSTPDGWLARGLDAKPSKSASAFRAVAMGSQLPRILRGNAGAVAMSNLAAFDVRQDMGQAVGGVNAKRGFESMYERGVRDLLYGTGRETFEAVKMLKAADPQRFQPENGAQYPRGRFGDSLRQIVQLIKADVGLEVAFTDSGGWDTHAAQGNEKGQLALRLREFAEGLAALHRDLGSRMDDVVILTMSEFGRTVRENGNRGTDHGHATAMLALGAVKGGKVYGRWPGLRADQLFEGRDLAVTTDFRNLFAEIALHHLGIPASAPLFPGFSANSARYPGVLV